MGLMKKKGQQKGLQKGLQKGAAKPAKGGRGIRSYWLSSVVFLLILVLLASAANFFLAKRTADSYSSQQTQAASEAVAAAIEKINFQQRKLLDGLAKQPALVALFEAGDPLALRAEQARLTALVPGVTQIRLFPAGTSQPDTTLTPKMGYASLQMLRQAERYDKVLPSEVHQFGTPHQHIAIAVGVRSAESGRSVGVIHAAFPAEGLQQMIDSVSDFAGRIELQQLAPDQPPFTLMGKGSESGTPPDKVLPITGSIWQIAYWGGVGAGLSTLDALLVVAPQLLVFLLAAVILFLLARQMMQALKKDQSTILTLFETVIKGRPPKAAPAQLADLQPTLDVLEHQIKEHRASRAERAKARPVAGEAETSGITIEEEAATPPQRATVGLSEPVDVPPSVYRAYDIRGVVDDTLTEAVMMTLGQGIGSEVFEQGFQSVLVARDARNSSDALQSALIQGLMASGRDVIDLGMVPTPLLYFAVHELNVECGAMVTGSHNPAQYNGVKLVVGRESPSSDKIQELRRRIDARQLLQGEGSFDSREIIDEYIERIISDIRLGQPLKVVVDCGNGAASVVAPELYRQLGCEVVELYCTVDGSFPNHHPDPGDPQNLQALQQAVVEHQAALGLAFDGDGDRLGVVDAAGNIIWPDRLLMYLAMDVLTREPGGDIIYDVKCSRHLANVILSNGGRPLMWKSGHSNMKLKMRETHALLAGEFSGHIIFSERWYGFDDGLYAGARLLEILSLDYRSSAEVFAELPDALATPEYVLRLEEGRPQALIKAIEQLPDLPGARLVKIDGLRAEFEQGWGLVRASNTTPALLFRFEADTQEGLTQVQSVFRDLLAKVAPDLQAPF